VAASYSADRIGVASTLRFRTPPRGALDGLRGLRDLPSPAAGEHDLQLLQSDLLRLLGVVRRFRNRSSGRSQIQEALCRRQTRVMVRTDNRLALELTIDWASKASWMDRTVWT
jgi:hypothetical protein